MNNRVQTFRRIWRRSPRLAFAWLTRKTARSAKRLIPGTDDWKMDWLGEEMRPFNSLLPTLPRAAEKTAAA